MAYSHEAWLHSRGPREERELKCSVCGETWWAYGRVEYGIWLPEDDDDLLCEDCWGEAE